MSSFSAEQRDEDRQTTAEEWKAQVRQEILHGEISGEHTGSGSGGITVHYHDIMETTQRKQVMGNCGGARTLSSTNKGEHTHM